MEKSNTTTATITSLKHEYNVSWAVMKNWLKKIGMERPNNGRIYTPDEVRKIREILGEP